MEKTVFISSNNMATFICPKCSKAKTVNVEQYAQMNKKVKVKCSCVCGHQFTRELEQRKLYRKKVNFPGKFTIQTKGKPMDKGTMVVQDISRTGLKLKLSVQQKLNIGDVMAVEFHLDDNRRTFMRKKVIVKNVYGPNVGVSFSPDEEEDPALGFYLMV